VWNSLPAGLRQTDIKRTSAMKSLSGLSLRLICLGVEIAAHCDYLFKYKFSHFLTRIGLNDFEFS